MGYAYRDSIPFVVVCRFSCAASFLLRYWRHHTSDFMIFAFSFAISPFASFNSWPKEVATRSTVSNWMAYTTSALLCGNKFSWWLNKSKLLYLWQLRYDEPRHQNTDSETILNNPISWCRYMDLTKVRLTSHQCWPYELVCRIFHQECHCPTALRIICVVSIVITSKPAQIFSFTIRSISANSSAVTCPATEVRNVNQLVLQENHAWFAWVPEHL